MAQVAKATNVLVIYECWDAGAQNDSCETH